MNFIMCLLMIDMQGTVPNVLVARMQNITHDATASLLLDEEMGRA